jgi:opacity protein-like surface antigen
MGLGLTGALEIYYTESNADDNSAGIDIEKDHDWGITFRPGLTFLDNNSPMGLKPYGILGWRRANFDASAAGLSDDEDFDGFELGLGTEVYAREAIGVRLDYSHVFYEEKNGIDPDEDSLRLGVLYHF